jgi:hypothetical protein
MFVICFPTYIFQHMGLFHLMKILNLNYTSLTQVYVLVILPYLGNRFYFINKFSHQIVHLSV